MRKVLICALAVVLLAVSSNQCITRGYIYSNIGTLFTWKSGAQSSWNGSNVVATVSDFTTYIQNSGSCTGASNSLITYGQATGCATNSNIHTPIFSNNTFAAGALSPWTAGNASACNGATFAPSSGTDQDGDGGYVSGSSLTCMATAAQVTLAQTFTASGTPTSQSYSLWYEGQTASSGSSSCTIAYGSVTLAVQVNSTTVQTLTPVLDGAWHQISGTTSALVSGSNTVTVTATLAGAQGQYEKTTVKPGSEPITTCVNVPGITAQRIAIDDLSLSAVW